MIQLQTPASGRFTRHIDVKESDGWKANIHLDRWARKLILKSNRGAYLLLGIHALEDPEIFHHDREVAQECQIAICKEEKGNPWEALSSALATLFPGCTTPVIPTIFRVVVSTQTEIKQISQPFWPEPLDFVKECEEILVNEQCWWLLCHFKEILRQNHLCSLMDIKANVQLVFLSSPSISAKCKLNSSRKHRIQKERGICIPHFRAKKSFMIGRGAQEILTRNLILVSWVL